MEYHCWPSLPLEPQESMPLLLKIEGLSMPMPGGGGGSMDDSTSNACGGGGGG